MKAKLKSWRLGYIYWPYPAITGAPLLLHMITSCSWILLELLNQMDGTFGLVCQSKWSSVMCDYNSLAKQYLLEWSLKLACSENNSRVVERHNQWNTSSHCQCMEDQSFAIFHDFGGNVAQEVQSEIFKYMIRKSPRKKLFCSSALDSSSWCSVSSEDYVLWTRSYWLTQGSSRFCSGKRQNMQLRNF